MANLNLESHPQSRDILERRSWLRALEVINQSWVERSKLSPSEQMISSEELIELWCIEVHTPPPSHVLSSLVEVFGLIDWPLECTRSQRESVLMGRGQLWGRLLGDLHAQLLPSHHLWRAKKESPELPLALYQSLSSLGVTVMSADGQIQLCTRREAVHIVKNQLLGFSALVHSSVRQIKPFEFNHTVEEGVRLEGLLACILNAPVSLLCELLPQLTKLLEIAPLCELSATHASLFDDLSMCRDLSVKREASAELKLHSARGWLQITLTAQATPAERKARVAKKLGGAHVVSPHHIALSCGLEHLLWRQQSHTPRTLEGRAFAIREMLRAACRVKPQTGTPGDLRGLFAPLVTLPAPLIWQLRLNVQTLLGRPMKTGRRSAKR